MLAELERMVAFALNHASRQQSELGDVQAQLASTEAALLNNRAPQWLPAPFNEAEAKQWAATIGKAKEAAMNSIESIERIAGVAHLPLTRGSVSQGAAYDRQDLDRLLNVANRTLRDVEDAVELTVSNLRAQVEALGSELELLRSLDPDNPQHRMNSFLREGAAEDIYRQFDRLRAIAESVSAYFVASGREPSPKALERLAEIAAARAAYAANRQLAIGESKLPDPVSTDANRLAIARDILGNPSYGFGDHGPIVLTTSDMATREKQVSRAEIKDVEFSLSGDITLSGSETTWTYRWEEFKFATPIKDSGDGQWYVWWITAKKFSSGWEKTPIGRWVSGGAVKGDQIPRENF
jgi:hypothetical protein